MSQTALVIFVRKKSFLKTILYYAGKVNTIISSKGKF